MLHIYRNFTFSLNPLSFISTFKLNIYPFISHTLLEIQLIVANVHFCLFFAFISTTFLLSLQKNSLFSSPLALLYSNAFFTSNSTYFFNLYSKFVNEFTYYLLTRLRYRSFLRSTLHCVSPYTGNHWLEFLAKGQLHGWRQKQHRLSD